MAYQEPGWYILDENDNIVNGPYATEHAAKSEMGEVVKGAEEKKQPKPKLHVKRLDADD